MKLTSWDARLTSLTDEVENVIAATRQSTKAGRTTLIERKVAVVQAGMRLDRVLRRIHRVMSREHMLLPRDRAFLDLCQKYWDVATRRAQVEREVLDSNLWLRLLRARIVSGLSHGGNSAAASFLDGDELVTLSVRHANFAKTERRLKSAWRDLDGEQRALVARYHELAVEKANRQASQSMGGRLGEDLAAALDGPNHAALAGYLRGLFLIAAGGDARAAFTRLEELYADKARSVVSACRNFVLGDKLAGPKRRKERGMMRMNAALRQLEDLEKDLQSSYSEHLGPHGTPAEICPNLVQSRQKQAKT